MPQLTTATSDSPDPASAPPSLPTMIARRFARIAGALLLLLCGCSLVLGGLAAIAMVHTVGIGKIIGPMIVIGLALIVGGWTTLKS